jgi:hypothetical protein
MMEKGEKVWRQGNGCESVGELPRSEIMREFRRKGEEVNEKHERVKENG